MADRRRMWILRRVRDSPDRGGKKEGSDDPSSYDDVWRTKRPDEWMERYTKRDILLRD